MRFKTLLTIVIFLCGIFMGLPSQSAQENSFLPGTEDIPLAPGFVVLNSDAFLFDTPAGQIVSVTIRSESGSFAALDDFYEQALPGLGWRRLNEGQFARDGDSLSWHLVSEQGHVIIVQFEIFLEGKS